MNDSVEQSDPVARPEGQVWALAAVVATLRETGTSSLEEALAADPARIAVLEAAGAVPAQPHPTGPVFEDCLPHRGLFDTPSTWCAPTVRLADA